MKESSPHHMPANSMDHMERFSSKLGRNLRKSGIDELPQLINVFRGEMSIVGPRPLIPEEGEIHNMRMKAGIYELSPGITGLAQINGGNAISNELKFEWDRQYLQNISLSLDMKICVKTIEQIVGSGFNKEDLESADKLHYRC